MLELRTLPIALALLLVAACDGTNASSDGGVDGGPPDAGPPAPPSRVDLLFVVDNSRGMGDEQSTFADAAAAIVRRIVSPPCADASGTLTDVEPGADCPAGTSRVHAPIDDLHVGFITSSLGSAGADTCAVESSACGGAMPNTTVDDRGRLIAREDPCGPSSVPTYQNEGYLAWDPAGTRTPPGESQLGDPASGAGLLGAVRRIVLGAGQIGCGFEAPLEAWYRFLVDPNPYESIAVESGVASLVGTDAVVLAQRESFLRPDSLVLIVLLTDEDDCSTRTGGGFYQLLQARDPSSPARVFLPPRARSECATDPNDPCCRSCAEVRGECPPDPACDTPLTMAEADVNLRCFEPKRRFGVDFRTPIERYLQGLTSTTVPDRNGASVPNPLFAGGRPASHVVFAAIAGVPWQDVAVDATDLSRGLRDAAEREEEVLPGQTAWDVMLGDPAQWIPPLDPFQRESLAPREGMHPLTGTRIIPPTEAPATNEINGREIATTGGLQYSCVMPLSEPRDCSGPFPGCECADPGNDSPACTIDPLTGAPTLQTAAVARPPTRILTLLRELGPQGVVGTLCEADTTGRAYGASVDAIGARVRSILSPR